MAIWNLNQIIEPEGLENLKKNLIDKVEKFKSYRNELNENISIEKVKEILLLKEEISSLSIRIKSYSFLKLVEDTSNIENNALENELSNFITNLYNEMLFFNLWFKDIDNENADRIINNIGVYSYYLKLIRLTKEYVLSEEIEQIINLKDLSGQDELVKLYDIITNRYKFNFFGKDLSLEELRVYVRSNKREERKQAYDLILNKYSDEEAILGEIYYSIVMDWFNENIKTRKFHSPISVRNISNDVSDKSIHSMLLSVKKNINLFHEYFEIKSKLLGIKMDRYDIYASLNEEKKIYDFDKSKKIVLDAYNNFSKTIGEKAKLVFDKDHIHSEIKDNKRSGAFCLSVNTKIEPYVMLNHVDTIECLFTMMHELGHAVHFILASKNPLLLAQSTLPLAETASIFGEMILSQDLLKQNDNEIKKTILMKMIDSSFASIARQSYFTLFEIEAHEAVSKGASITDLNDLYYNQLKEQFGSLNVDEKFKHEWKYIPHFYHSPFYCYAYAYANLLVLALYDMYLENPNNFEEKYIRLLSSGGNNSPANILNEIGINVEDEKFWERGFHVIRKQIDELKKLV